jgi:tetratricopeptide (TPR) repeat protein
MRGAVARSLTKAAAPVALIGAAGGFISDVLLPLGNFATLMFFFTGIVTVLLYGLLYYLFQKRNDDIWDTIPAGVFLAAFAASMIFGIWSMLLQLAPEKGYIASNVEPIAQIQASLLNLEEDVEAIKQTTEAIATQQAEGFASLEEALANIQSGQQVIIESPTQPQEWYNNARVYTLRGDSVNAIAAYEGYFASDSNLEFVDPYEDYIALLLATQGISRARDIIGDITSRNPDNVTSQLMLASMLDSVDERIPVLEDIVRRNPQYGPGYYYLGLELDRKLRESVTNDLLQKQTTAYSTLISLEEESQLFSLFYIDKLVAQEHVAAARFQQEAYQQAVDVFSNAGVEVYVYSEGVQFIIIFPETDGQDLFYSIDNPDPNTSTGKVSAGGQEFLQQSVGPINVPVGEHIFYFRYIDKNGVESEIFEHPFEVPPIIVIFTGSPPDFSTGNVTGSFVFQIPYTDTSANYTFEYSLDDPSLDTSVTGFAITTAEYDSLEPGEHTLYVRATPLGGTPTEVVEFMFTVDG